MKLRSLLLSLIIVTSLTVPALADNTIAVVNTQEIMHEATAAKSVKEQLDAKEKSFKEEMTKKEESLQKDEQNLSKQRAVLSPEAFDKKVKDFKSEYNSAQKEAQAKHAELEQAFSSAFNEIQKTVSDIVTSMAKEKGYNVVLPSGTLIYADPKLDITKDVLAKLNSKLPKVTVNFKASAKDE